MKIAMWSGPRNLSTAMMYAFGARTDCAVSDEPFYAAYLKATGIIHPMQNDILSSQPQNPETVADHCTGPAPDGKAHWYQKHMCQHMIDGFPLDWANDCKNVYLIRHPARVIASYAAKREQPSLQDIGFPQQAALYDRLGGTIIDSADIRNNPREMLTKLCAAIDLPFQETMLNWPAGGHVDDGIWAKHWYASVWKSTGFAGPEGPLPKLSGEMETLCNQAMPFYEKLKEHSL
jgi:hypothetical protein